MTDPLRARHGARAASAGREPASDPARDSAPRQHLRLLSYNIQTGITTRRYHEYVTHSWKHLLPHRTRDQNMLRIAELVADYDIVGLQEVDAGSLRTGFVNQTEYLATRAGFPWWYSQTNRRLGKLAQHSLGFLSRYPFTDVEEIRLPGAVPGRGALMVRFETGSEPLLVLVVHLALSRRGRIRQLRFLGKLLRGMPHVVVMGDLNCGPHSPEVGVLRAHSGLRVAAAGLNTFPSWRPGRHIDQILVSSGIGVTGARVLPSVYSDHLPLAMDVALPAGLHLAGTLQPAAFRAAG